VIKSLAFKDEKEAREFLEEHSVVYTQNDAKIIDTKASYVNLTQTG